MKRYLLLSIDDSHLPDPPPPPATYETTPVLEWLNATEEWLDLAYDRVAEIMAGSRLAGMEHAGISDSREYDA